MPVMMPATAASAPEIAHTVVLTRPMATPRIWASSRLDATALMSRPTPVRPSRSHNPPMTTTATRSMTISPGATLNGPM